MNKKWWPSRLFRSKHPHNLHTGEPIWAHAGVYLNTVAEPYRVLRIEPQCPGQIYMEIGGQERSGTFQLGWGSVYIPRYHQD